MNPSTKVFSSNLSVTISNLNEQNEEKGTFTSGTNYHMTGEQLNRDIRTKPSSHNNSSFRKTTSYTTIFFLLGIFQWIETAASLSTTSTEISVTSSSDIAEKTPLQYFSMVFVIFIILGFFACIYYIQGTPRSNFTAMDTESGRTDSKLSNSSPPITTMFTISS